MADPEAQAEDTPDEESKPKNWRRQLEADRDQALEENVRLKQELALHESGLKELSDEQRSDVITLAKAKGDTSPDALKAIAERLSYTKPPAAPAPEGVATSAQVENPAAGELQELAALTDSPASLVPDSPPDLSELYSPTAVADFLKGQIDESWGPPLPT